MGCIDRVGARRVVAVIVDNPSQGVTALGCGAAGNTVETFSPKELCHLLGCPAFSSYHFSSDHLFRHRLTKAFFSFWGLNWGIVRHRSPWGWCVIFEMAHKTRCKLGDHMLFDGIVDEKIAQCLQLLWRAKQW